MSNKAVFRWMFVMIILGLLAVNIKLTKVTRAQTGGGYDLTWNTIGGSEPSTGGGYELSGVVGQPSVNMLSSSGYTLGGGFWGGGAAPPPEYKYIYLPLVLRSY